MREGKGEERSISSRIWVRTGEIVEKRAAWIVMATIVATFLLIAPIVLMSPDRQASGNPGGEVFDLTDRIEDKMPPANMYWSFILEARDGDVLTREVLWELFKTEEMLRNSEFGIDYLSHRYDVELGTRTQGVYTIADAVNEFLLIYFERSLEFASDDEVKYAVYRILSSPIGKNFHDTFSITARWENGTVLGENIQVWKTPAIFVNTICNRNMVMDEYSKGLDDDLEDSVIVEYFYRDLQDHLRGEQRTYRLWGIAIDISLEAGEEGALSIPLVAAAVVIILILVTIIFRSPKVLLLTIIGIMMLIVWLKGISNLVGLNSSLTIDILVPVSMLVLGVDYAIHGIHRYEEERGKEPDPRKAIRLSVAGVGGTLFLAMATTVVAFSSNAVSNIEEIMGFGVSASIAIISAFWIMGFFLPAAKMLWDYGGFRKGTLKGSKVRESVGSRSLGDSVLWVAKRKRFVIPVALVFSLIMVYFALHLQAQLDVKEYFDPTSDVVVSLDKMDEYAGDKGGEPAYIYIEGDLSNPAVLDAINDFKDDLEDDRNIARDPQTKNVSFYFDIFEYFKRILLNNYTKSMIEEYGNGINLTDLDGDLLPDSTSQLKLVLGYMYENGLPYNETTIMYSTDQIREVFWKDPEDDTRYATVVIAGVPDTRELSTVKASAREIKEDMKALDVDGITYYGLTGSGYERDATLTAITDSLTTSIGIAVVMCFLVLVVMFRSFKYALITVIPELLVVSWLYAFMFIAGYHLNAVTATIAAISIGVGIDYSVHVTARFREEYRRMGRREDALHYATRHSGVALFGSAASTIIGFAIIALAPMPMFSSFGILTALMILMALIAALMVLPSLLLLVTREGPDQ
ncbi:MAG: MMPL family transporter [Candidatus Thermoplasmatota archaeon]|nr:MMPL family transporter [Candidatus Thermoplasmatota archaeon]